jgi:hypothetical protein
MWKHKMQTIFNILGLAVGFACFVFWMTYTVLVVHDDFPHAERSFTVGQTQPPGIGEIPFSIVAGLQ